MRTRRAYVDLIWNGAAVAGKMSGYQKDVTYTDPASGEADSIDVSIHDRGGKWIGPWFPETGDTLAATITPDMIQSWNWDRKLAGTYTGGEYTYTDPGTEEEIKVNVGEGPRILKVSGKADSKADAERKIKAAVANANHGTRKMSVTITGTASLVASQCVAMVGLGKMSGKYYIDQITHHIGGSGYNMDLDLSLVE